MTTAPAELGRRFLDLHRRDKTLLLPNAWDVPSAQFRGSGLRGDWHNKRGHRQQSWILTVRNLGS